MSTWATEAEEQALAGPLLQRLAYDTGGLAIEHTNDLGDGLSAVARELGQYYELVYAPANPTQDGRFRRIAVKTTRSNVRLRTRAGYYATAQQTAVLPAYELPLLAALAETVPASHFGLRTRLLHFAATAGERQCVLLLEVPLSEIQLKTNEAESLFGGRLGLLAYLKDGNGRTVARFSHDWPLTGALAELPAARQQGAVFRRELRLAPGGYRLEAAIQDRESGATTVMRSAFEVPAPGALSLGSVAVIRRASAAGADEADPLRVGSLSLHPDLGGPLVATPGRELPVLVNIYPARSAEPVQLDLTFLQGETVVARAAPPLPAADADGRIAWVGSVPWSQLKPGAYELVATVRQGIETAVESTRFEVVAAARTVESSAPPSGADAPGPAPVNAAAPARSAVDPTLAPVLERVGRYVVEYADKFGNLVAEESYTQRSWGTDERLRPTETAPLRMSDHLLQRTRADLVFVRLGGEIPWGLFRDVFEANGVKVRDRDARLEKLFSRPSASLLEQAGRVLAESARYNIGPRRTVNTPTLALMFLHPRNQSRFAFKRGGRRRIAGADGLEIQFEEVQRPAITSDLQGGTVPTSGSFYVDETRGIVLRSEVAYRFEPNRAVGRINTEYRPEQRLALWVPSEMFENYEDRPGTRDPVFRAAAQATAHYSNFRRFEVSTEEQKVSVPGVAEDPK